YPINNNLGMISVDFALDSMLRSLHIDASGVKRFTIMTPHQVEVPGVGLLEYDLLRDADQQLKPYDTIIYWGDFLHSYGYYVSLQRKLHDQHGLTLKDAAACIFKNIFLKDV